MKRHFDLRTYSSVDCRPGPCKRLFEVRCRVIQCSHVSKAVTMEAAYDSHDNHVAYHKWLRQNSPQEEQLD